MFKTSIGKLTCGVALLVGFVACGAGSEEAPEDFAAETAVEGLEASGGDLTESGSNEAEPVGGADTSASVEASGLVCTDCFLNLVTCFPVRDAIFAQTGVVCVCQPPDLDQCCSTNTFDLECNL